MEESILTSVKKMLGIAEEYEHFDADLIMHINSVFSILTQLGAGPSNGFSIRDKKAVWKDFLSNSSMLEMVKTYMHHRVKLMFDPPLTASVIESMNRIISELEWRINVAVDPSEGNVFNGTKDESGDGDDSGDGDNCGCIDEKRASEEEVEEMLDEIFPDGFEGSGGHSGDDDDCDCLDGNIVTADEVDQMLSDVFPSET